MGIGLAEDAQTKKIKIIDSAKVHMHLSFYGKFLGSQGKREILSASRITGGRGQGLWTTTGSEEKPPSTPLALSVATTSFNIPTEYSLTLSKTTAHSTNRKSRTSWHLRNASRCLRYRRAFSSLLACDAKANFKNWVINLVEHTTEVEMLVTDHDLEERWRSDGRKRMVEEMR